MIDRASIMAWAEHAPWTDFAMVEQDLIICRALVDIFSDDFLKNELAFRGGTALHKLYLHPQPRYSEDIDLVQMLRNLNAITIQCFSGWNPSFLRFSRFV